MSSTEASFVSKSCLQTVQVFQSVTTYFDRLMAGISRWRCATKALLSFRKLWVSSCALCSPASLEQRERRYHLLLSFSLRNTRWEGVCSLFKNVLMLCKANIIYICIFMYIILDNYSRPFCAAHYSTFQTACMTVLDVFLSLRMNSFDLSAYIHLDSREDLWHSNGVIESYDFTDREGRTFWNTACSRKSVEWLTWSEKRRLSPFEAWKALLSFIVKGTCFILKPCMF